MISKTGVLIALPILLGAALWVARDASEKAFWARQGEEMRQQMRADLKSLKQMLEEEAFVELTVYDKAGRQRNVGAFDAATTAQIVSSIELQAATSVEVPKEGEPALFFWISSGDCYEQSGFTLSLDGNRSSFSGANYAATWSETFRGCQLTPAAGQKMRQIANANFGRQIAQILRQKP